MADRAPKLLLQHILPHSISPVDQVEENSDAYVNVLRPLDSELLTGEYATATHDANSWVTAERFVLVICQDIDRQLSATTAKGTVAVRIGLSAEYECLKVVASDKAVFSDRERFGVASDEDVF